MKKIIICMLALVLMLSLCTVFASAEEDTYSLIEDTPNIGFWLASVSGPPWVCYSEDSFVAATFTAAKPFASIAIPYWSGNPNNFEGIVPCEVEFALFKAEAGKYAEDYKSEDAVVREVRTCDCDVTDFVWTFDQQPAGRYCLRIWQLTEEQAYIVIAQGEPADDDAEFEIDAAMMQNTGGKDGLGITIIYGEGSTQPETGDATETPAATEAPADPTDAPAATDAPAEQGEVTIPDNAVNVALEKEIEVNFDDDYNGTLFDNTWFTVNNITDGIVSEVPQANIPTDMPLGWYVGTPKRETSVYAMIDLEGLYDVSAIRITPMNFLKGANMPSDYEIMISENGSDWVTVASETGISEKQAPILDPFTYAVNQKAAYVMLHITKASTVTDGTFYSGIDEVEVFGVEIPKTPKPTEQATEAPVATEAPATDASVENKTDKPADATADNAATDKGNSDDQNKNTEGKKTNVGLIIGICAGVLVIAGAVIGIIAAKKKKK
ncbi:MAG: discoidin domain-containing protein [Clostridia bacterium]|nr:discoidin domain-containing protein [Clostridia bacterium]